MANGQHDLVHRRGSAHRKALGFASTASVVLERQQAKVRYPKAFFASLVAFDPMGSSDVRCLSTFARKSNGSTRWFLNVPFLCRSVT